MTLEIVGIQNPFFSRRIGIAENLDGDNIENDIIAGVRLSGKLTNNTRIGVLNMQTTDDESNEIAATNNAVLTVQQKLFSRSNISVMFINKQATKDYDFLEDSERYNRVVGLDYRLASADNTWTGKYFLHKSFSPDSDSKDFSYGASTEYNSRNYNVRLSGVFVGENYNSALGFIRRKDIFKINPSFQRNFWPKQGKIQRHSFEVIPIVSGEHKRLTAEQIANELREQLKGAHAYFCGPTAMREALRVGLMARGLRRARFHYEEFEMRQGIDLTRLVHWAWHRLVGGRQLTQMVKWGAYPNNNNS